MSGVTRYPIPTPPYGQPQPLHLPIDEVPFDEPRRQKHREPRSNGHGDHDLPGERVPGSHVIIVDLA